MAVKPITIHVLYIQKYEVYDRPKITRNVNFEVLTVIFLLTKIYSALSIEIILNNLKDLMLDL